jgi:hypothetical protein
MSCTNHDGLQRSHQCSLWYLLQLDNMASSWHVQSFALNDHSMTVNYTLQMQCMPPPARDPWILVANVLYKPWWFTEVTSVFPLRLVTAWHIGIIMTCTKFRTKLPQHDCKVHASNAMHASTSQGPLDSGSKCLVQTMMVYRGHISVPFDICYSLTIWHHHDMYKVSH